MATGTCFLCGNYETVETHHIFGGPFRPKADRLGLTVQLCPWCHQYDADSAHKSGETRKFLHQYGQRKAMKEQGWDVDEFIIEFGRNYLDAEDLTEDGYLREDEDVGDNSEAFQLVRGEAELPWG